MTADRTWMVRAGPGGGTPADDFHEKNFVAIGWPELADLSGVTSRPRSLLSLTRLYWPAKEAG